MERGGFYLKLGIAFFLVLLLGCTYTYRVVLWNTSDIGDYLKFPERAIDNSPPVFHFEKSEDPDVFKRIFPKAEYEYGRKKIERDWEEFLESTGTTAFIVIKRDTILYEGYFNGYRRDSVNVSFSVAKSFLSALIGIAVDEGLIGGVDDPVTKYLPQLDREKFDKVTIRNMLMMSSGLRWRDGEVPWRDNPLHYYHPHLRKLLLNMRKFESEPGRYFHYNSYNTLLMGMVLEKAVGMSVTEWTEKKLWKPLGMEFPASWSIDSVEGGLEKTGSSLNARAIDYAKLGRLFLRKGDWNGKRIVSEKWVVESTSRDRSAEGKDYYKSHKLLRKRSDFYYKYFWWGFSDNGSEYDYAACGHLGQYIYVSPSADVVIVRNGKKWGRINLWLDLMRHTAAGLRDR